jgi:outer membrane protein TolC
MQAAPLLLSLLLGFAALLPLEAARGAPLPTLEQLEEQARSSLAMRALDASLEMAMRRAAADRLSTSPRLYGAGGLANGDELLDPTRTRAYSRVTSEVGLRVPVLGSRARILATNQQLSASLRRREAEVELARRDIIRRVRMAYADLWTAQQTARLSRAYLEGEATMTRVLQLRTSAGLLLGSERQQLLASFEVARTQLTQAERDAQRALQDLGVLVAADLPVAPAAGLVAYPRVAPGCGAGPDLAYDVDSDPEIVALDADLGAVGPRAAGQRWRDIGSEVRLGYQLATEGQGDRNGGAAVVGWSFEMPLDVGRQRHRIAAAAASETDYLALQRELRRTEIRNLHRDLEARRDTVRQSRQLAHLQLRAAEQATRERELRAARLAGDVFEQLLVSRRAQHVAARAQVDADRNELLWYADWARFDTRACVDSGSPDLIEPAPAPPRAPVPAPQTATLESRQPGRALYLWTSQPWLTGSAQETGDALSRLRASGIRRLMVSLDADQIAQQARDGSPLRRLAERAASAGIGTELLLGEPTWILPKHRARLLQIVRQLRDAPFHGLHLDLEPNMLDDSPAGTARLLPELVQTLRAVKAVSPWPVACSLHPRYLTAATDGVALGDRLTELGVAPTLMIYVANPQRVVEIARPIMARFPALRFGVALSVEHTLDREESLFSFPEPERASRIAAVEQGLAGDNFSGIALQPSLPWMAQWLGRR